MSDDDTLQRQIADIGARYLRRTVGEIAQLRERLEAAQAGEAGALHDLERLAHKINGSGAMFGFDALSNRADEVERLAKSAPADAQLFARLDAALAGLEAEVRLQAAKRGAE